MGMDWNASGGVLKIGKVVPQLIGRRFVLVNWRGVWLGVPASGGSIDVSCWVLGSGQEDREKNNVRGGEEEKKRRRELTKKVCS